MMFSVGGMETRHPFRIVDTAPANIMAREEFTSRDGTLYTVVLCVDGSLYSLIAGAYTLLDQVAPGSTMNTVVAYGRIYMAFFIEGQVGGSDAPRAWDGKNLFRVSQGGPGAAPQVTCISLGATQLVDPVAGITIPIVSATPTDPQQVQVGGGSGDDGYDPPIYQTFYTTLTVVTTTPDGLAVGNVVSISGNSQWNVAVGTVSAVIDADTFKITFSTTDNTPGTGGTVDVSSPLLTRINNDVTATTQSPHNLRVGFQVAISGVDDLTYAINDIEVSAASWPNQAQITFTTDQGFVPGDVISITDVPDAVVGAGVMGYDITNGVATVTMNGAHGLSVGLAVIVSLHTYAPRNVTVAAVLSPTVWTYETSEPNVTDTGGYVHVPFPTEVGEQYTIAAVTSPTTVLIPFGSSDFIWSGGNVDFPWNGTFYVDSVPSATTFTYRQSGPDATLQTGSGTVTPVGQISPGEHQVVQHFQFMDDTISPPSPPVRFTAKVSQYPLVTMAIGPANVKARILSFTGVNGGDFAMLLVPARVGGVQVSTSTVVQDNTTQSAIVDFPDTALLSATRIDIPGNNLFECFTLTTPDGVEWFSDRLFWKGEKNVMLGMNNMGFDGGTLLGSTAPLGWFVRGEGGAIVQSGFMPVYQIGAGESGGLSQSCVRNYDGAEIMQPNTRYTMRLWADGAHDGNIVVTITSASLGFATAVNVPMLGRGYSASEFPENTPAVIPDDMVINIASTSSQQVQIRDMQVIYSDNPNKWPTAQASYVQQPGTYDFVTGVIGPNDDSTELRAMFARVQENLYFITASGRLYYVQQIGNTEPSSWNPQGVSDSTPAFNANAVVTGNGWAAWGGDNGAFWFNGSIPARSSAVVDPTWKLIAGISSMVNDASNKRVYFAAETAAGRYCMAFDYHELELGGAAKWCPWMRPIVHLSTSAANGILFAANAKTYRLDDAAGIADDDFGNIGGYYTFAPAGAGLYQKSYNYLAMRMSGTGTMTPFLYKKNLLAVTQTLNAQVLQNDPDAVVEYPANVTQARLLYMKIGQPGLQFTFEACAWAWGTDPNSPFSGTRK